MRKFLFLSLGILAVMLFAQSMVFACGCPGRNQNTAQAAADEFNNSSLVFVGRVTESKWLPVTDKNLADKQIKAEVLTLKFTAREWLKGKSRKEVVWQTSSIRYPATNVGVSGSNCEYYFEVGKSYLVYAMEIKGKLIADVCGGTGEVEKAGADLNELRKLKKTRNKTNIQ